VDCQTIVRGGAIATPDGMVEADVAVGDGQVVAVGPALALTAVEEIDASGLCVVPGVVDAHVHFNDPGRADWEGFASGSRAAAAGGGACVVDMPLNAPPTDYRRRRVPGEARCRARLVADRLRLLGWARPGKRR
jgi:allantoinase